jgi:hypothetical protein
MNTPSEIAEHLAHASLLVARVRGHIARGRRVADVTAVRLAVDRLASSVRLAGTAEARLCISGLNAFDRDLAALVAELADAEVRHAVALPERLPRIVEDDGAAVLEPCV